MRTDGLAIDGPFADDLRLALRIADQVDPLTLAGFTAEGLVVESKPDLSPVTEVDRAAERVVREVLAEERPGDAIAGEEYGVTGTGSRQWVVDPIDGTKNFIRGIPVWGTLIALVVDREPVVGVVSAPALGQRWFAAQGQGAWKGAGTGDSADIFAGARRLQVSKITDLADATLSYASLTGWEEHGLLDRFLEFQRGLWRTRAFGDFWSYMLVAEGVVDVATEPELALHDMAALVPIVHEAGGRFTSLAGEEGPWGPDALASNGLVHEAALAALSH